MCSHLLISNQWSQILFFITGCLAVIYSRAWRTTIVPLQDLSSCRKPQKNNSVMIGSCMFNIWLHSLILYSFYFCKYSCCCCMYFLYSHERPWEWLISEVLVLSLWLILDLVLDPPASGVLHLHCFSLMIYLWFIVPFEWELILASHFPLILLEYCWFLYKESEPSVWLCISLTMGDIACFDIWIQRVIVISSNTALIPGFLFFMKFRKQSTCHLENYCIIFHRLANWKCSPFSKSINESLYYVSCYALVSENFIMCHRVLYTPGLFVLECFNM